MQGPIAIHPVPRKFYTYGNDPIKYCYRLKISDRYKITLDPNFPLKVGSGVMMSCHAVEGVTQKDYYRLGGLQSKNDEYIISVNRDHDEIKKATDLIVTTYITPRQKLYSASLTKLGPYSIQSNFGGKLNTKAYLPREIHHQIMDHLDPTSASNANRFGWHQKPEQNKNIDHARVWGSVFKPDLSLSNLLNPSRDLILYGSDIKYLYEATKRPRDRPLIILIATTKNRKPQHIKNYSILEPYLRSCVPGNGYFYLPDFNIKLYYQNELEIQDLWRLGTENTKKIKYKESEDLEELPIFVHLQRKDSQSYNKCQSELHPDSVYVLEYSIDGLDVYSKATHCGGELIQYVYNQWFSVIK